MSESIILRGAPGSPYTRKMLGVLRYRRIPYQLRLGGLFADETENLPKPKVELLPTFYLPGDDGVLKAVVDSTPIIRQLEVLYPGRSVIPEHPLLRFLDYLLEDYADEWLTKAMFHYRWHYQADIDKAGAILPRWRSLTASEEENAVMSKFVKERQISRLHVVGSSDLTAPIIEDSYKRMLSLMAQHMNSAAFMFGHRPAASDFGLYGQLTQLACFDPTPMAVADELAARVVAWVGVLEDLSGMEVSAEHWFEADQLPESLRAIFCEIGRVYVPVLLANAEAIENGDSSVQTRIDGHQWVQQPFPYQAKCLHWLRQEYVRLDESVRGDLLGFLSATGCERLFDSTH